MTNDERWDIFISELKAYIQEHQKCPPKHCTLYNAQKYYRRKMKEGTLDEEKSRELECVLGLRDLSLHTGRAESLKIGAVDSASSPTKCLEIVVPSDEFNVVYLLSHIYRHLLGLGIGLRQLMDYYFALRAVSEDSKVSEGFKVSEVSGTLKSLGLYDFAGAVMYVLKEVFGLEREYMICEPEEWRGKALLESVMESANFGRGQKKMPTWLRKMKQWSDLVVMYPSETLSDPVWRIYKNLK